MASRGLDLGALRLFIEVAQSGSLTAAAQHLGLTQPAVSYQIRQLEAEVGTLLFNRQHRGVELTASGRLLFETGSKSLRQIDGVVRNIRDQARSRVRIFTDYAFSALWLLPRLQKFQEAFPQIDLQVIANQQMLHKQPAQQAYEAEIYILFGTQRDYGGSGDLLLPETVAPVCSSAFAASHGPFDQPDQLMEMPLLHLEADADAAWYTWAHYFSDQALDYSGKRLSGGSHYNTYTLILQAALANAGVAIGWLGLIGAHLQAQELVKVGPQLCRSDRGYWLMSNSDRADSNSQNLKDWILNEVQDAGAFVL